MAAVSPYRASAAELKERIEAERAGYPFLVYRKPDGGQVIATLSAGQTTTIGRDSECEISLARDEGVSRLHAELTTIGSEWVIVDDGLEQRPRVRLHGRDAEVELLGDLLVGRRGGGVRALADGQRFAIGDLQHNERSGSPLPTPRWTAARSCPPSSARPSPQ
jgi:pSer/pThr/pTyr-binding forkhead associated (FHA) protein